MWRSINPAANPDATVTHKARKAFIGFAFPWVLLAIVGAAKAAENDAGELVNFSFARYLGTGYYSTDESDVFVVQVPLTHQLRPMSGDSYGIVLRYPVTLGITNFDLDGKNSDGDQELPDVPKFDDVATLSLVPGLEFQFPLLDNWYVAPFIDLGLAQDLDSNKTSRLFGVGMKSFADFTFERDTLRLGHRLLYSRQDNIDGDGSSSFSVLQSGLDYRFLAAQREGPGHYDISLYYIHNYYINDLGIPRAFDDTISFTNTNELGFTLDLPPMKWLPEDPRIGFGVQLVDDVEIYRVVFGAPLF